MEGEGGVQKQMEDMIKDECNRQRSKKMRRNS
jgi:hypothetical protein